MEIGRASPVDLSSLASLVLFGGLVYALSGYFKAVILAFKLPGPPAVPLFGNALMLKERDMSLLVSLYALVAGQETIAVAVAFCLFTLAQQADIQQKCYNELVGIFREDTRAPNMSDLRAMKYLEMCIKESLRLHPSIPAFGRQISEGIQIGKHTLPACSNIVIVPYCTHRLPHIYPDPEKFDPERFTTENCKKRHPYAYLPFSAGVRNCIGHKYAMLEMKTIISKVLRCYKLLPVPGKTDFRVTFRITLRSSGGLWIRLQPREGI